MWNAFGIGNLSEYHDLYLKIDVLLLCDVFEKFISVCLEYYGLDPCHYFSNPRLSWDAMLKMTGVELDLIDDIDVHLFIEKGMRGGIYYIAKRYCRANNEYIEGYDESSDDRVIIYFDANKLYGWAMTQYLPYGGLKWMSEVEIDEFNFDLVGWNNDEGYILEVDLKYPDDLHDFHNDYPLTPEKLRVINDMLFEYCSDIAEKYGVKVGEVNKLGNKGNYVVHYRNLQLYKLLGMRETRIHRVLKYSNLVG